MNTTVAWSGGAAGGAAGGAGGGGGLFALRRICG